MTFTAEALVVIDMQQGFLSGPAAIPGADALAATVTGLLTRARRAGALIVHLQNDGPEGEPDEPGTPGWELVLAEPGEQVLRKTDDDGFEDTVLGSLLEERGVERLTICGLLSEMCVSATARTALRHDYEVALPHDAHGTYDLDDIPAAVVARVAEHALGDEIDLPRSGADVRFTAPPKEL
ncbi:isochorismatase family protein [Nonomuraea typhae]|uniref:isochorismatase family protein n=1 Tax=Nonomuraea typhae TaxID=2603600 RepID=UPI0012FA1EE0|nr:isochorismatase family protein [Nonomuraea typhae]